MTDKPISEYVNRPLRDLCKCKRGPVRAETEMCIHCEQDAQANVIEVDFEKVVRLGDDR